MDLFERIDNLIDRISQDLVELRETCLKLNELAVTDELTGLYNRRLFWKRLTEEMSRAVRYDEPVSVLVLDIDNFKNYNDAYGHYIGDQLLREVSNVIKENVRAIDVVARYGGEEFAVILPQANLEGALKVAERVRLAVSRHVFPSLDGASGPTVSGGIAGFPEDGSDPDEIFEIADRALFRAKQLRNCIVTARDSEPHSAPEATRGQAG